MTVSTDSSATRTRAQTPSLLVIDDMETLPDEITSSYPVDHVLRLDDVDGYLARVDPADPPMAALIDVNLDTEFGVAALHRLRAHPATARTVPILFTSTARKGGTLHEDFAVSDLHALLCAAACDNKGIMICSKEHDLDVLHGSLRRICELRRRPGPVDLIGEKHGDLRFVRPIRVATGGSVPAKSLVHILLGNEVKRSFWEYLVDNPRDPNAALRQLLKDTRPKPSFTLEKPGSWKVLPKDPLRQFVQGEVGRVVRAWDAVGGNFLHPRVTGHGVLALPDDDGRGNPGLIFTVFASRYARLLSNLGVGRFAEWFLQQEWGRY